MVGVCFSCLSIIFTNPFSLRIDRLGAIILNEWFPYYEETEENPMAVPVQIQDEIGQAYNIWDSNWVEKVVDQTYRVRFHE